MSFQLALRRALVGAVLCGAGASGASAQASLPPSLELRVPKAPTLGTADGGSFVAYELAFYAHLKPGAIRVKVGDTVKEGQVVGLVGNTGNSTEPHLHFHISDGNSPLGSEGVPYGFDSFEIVGRCKTFNVGCTRETPTARHGEIPLENVLVRFP